MRMGNNFANIVNFIFALIGAIIVIGIIIRVIINLLSKEKSIKAIVVDKQCYDKQIYRKSQAPFMRKEYVITFLCGNKKRYFNVSELSYRNYKVNQKGTLKYKGNQIVDFK